MNDSCDKYFTLCGDVHHAIAVSVLHEMQCAHHRLQEFSHTLSALISGSRCVCELLLATEG
jgi:hypothetical protein